MTTDTLTVRSAIIAALHDMAGDRLASVYGQYADRILAIVNDAETDRCRHLAAMNSDDGYIVCEDCGDWLGVWRVR